MKRFYKAAAIDEQGEAGFGILLDDKPVKTPARHVLRIPTRALAEAILAEWRDQGEDIVPASMPLLRFANTVIDGIGKDRAGVIAAILRFGEHDLLCYRAETPALAVRQHEAWDPLLEWADEVLGAHLTTTIGISAVAQDPRALAALQRAVASCDDFSLAALHVMASITGSLVLALAAMKQIGPEQAFMLSRLEESYQAERWGLDHEAEQRALALGEEMNNAARLMTLSRI